MNSPERKNVPGIFFGVGRIAILCALLAGSLYFGIEPRPNRPSAGSVLLGLYIICWGLMFLASYFFSHTTFFLRGLLWVCERFSVPAGRKMAFYYFVLALSVGPWVCRAGLVSYEQ